MMGRRKTKDDHPHVNLWISMIFTHNSKGVFMNNPANIAKCSFFFRLLQHGLGKFRFRLRNRYPVFCNPDLGREGKSDLVGFVTTKSGGFPIVEE
jgi:hypothetical protein